MIRNICIALKLENNTISFQLTPWHTIHAVSFHREPIQYNTTILQYYKVCIVSVLYEKKQNSMYSVSWCR